MINHVIIRKKIKNFKGKYDKVDAKCHKMYISC